MTDTTPRCGSNSEARKRLAEKASTPDDRDALAYDAASCKTLAAELADVRGSDLNEALGIDINDPIVIAAEVLSSDWLAEHDTQVRRETAEKIAREFTRRADPSSEGVWRDACNLLAEIARQSSEGGGEDA